MTYIAFFDVDGTLCTSSGEVLPSTVEAIQAFRNEGNLAYICTGRSKPEIIESILAIGFDGIIGAGGGYVTIGEDVLIHQTMPKPMVLDMIAYFDQHDIGYYLESNDGLFASENCERKISEAIRKIAKETKVAEEPLLEKMTWFVELVKQFDEIPIDYGNVNKISFINNTVPFLEIERRYGEEFHMYQSTVALFGPESGEIAVRGVNKQTAIEFVLETLNLDKTQALAFGDGDNDLAMFAAVGYTVAMDNATDRLKKAANEVTADADEDGIAKSMAKKLWIKKEA
ncbi:HAD family hydrolase [uncultured Enterococcus sp.]|uniref:HAD family hydrolase n=1 Tax=uncultured Enterococcus sp. TaxID=167972 RepID=UPI0025FDA9D6|nr:HAD family hydrolase [uncultured Enterococcus sp.]